MELSHLKRVQAFLTGTKKVYSFIQLICAHIQGTQTHTSHTAPVKITAGNKVSAGFFFRWTPPPPRKVPDSYLRRPTMRKMR